MGPAGLLRAVSRCPVPAAKATLAAVPRQARGRLPGVGEGPLLLSQGGGARQAQALSERHSTTWSDHAHPDTFLPLLGIQVSGGVQCGLQAGDMVWTCERPLCSKHVKTRVRKRKNISSVTTWAPTAMPRRPGQRL